MLSHLQGYTLAALCQGPTHGYALTKRIEELANGGLNIHASRVYVILHKFAQEGLVTRSGDNYHLTSVGLTVLADDLLEDEHYIQMCREALQAVLNNAVRYGA